MQFGDGCDELNVDVALHVSGGYGYKAPSDYPGSRHSQNCWDLQSRSGSSSDGSMFSSSSVHSTPGVDDLPVDTNTQKVWKYIQTGLLDPPMNDVEPMDAIADVPTASAVNGDVPTGSAVIGDVPTASAVNGDVPTGSAVNGDVPTASAVNGDVPTASAVIGDVPTASTVKADVPKASAVNGDVPTTSAVNAHADVTTVSRVNADKAVNDLVQVNMPVTRCTSPKHKPTIPKEKLTRDQQIVLFYKNYVDPKIDEAVRNGRRADWVVERIQLKNDVEIMKEELDHAQDKLKQCRIHLATQLKVFNDAKHAAVKSGQLDKINEARIEKAELEKHERVVDVARRTWLIMDQRYGAACELLHRNTIELRAKNMIP